MTGAVREATTGELASGFDQGQPGVRPFGDWALHLHDIGLSVLPCGNGRDGKAARLKGWKQPLDHEQVRRFSQLYAGDNVAFLAGASGLAVVDIDSTDPDLVDEMIGRFGDTPIMERTGSGNVHLYYQGSDLIRKIDLRRTQERLPVEIIGGANYVVAPPSYNRKTGGRYHFERGGWGDLKDLPSIRRESLADIVEKATDWARTGPVGSGDRGVTLNKRLCRDVSYCDSLDDLLDVARTHNQEMIPPLTDSEVVDRARAVWRDRKAGKIQPMLRGPSVVKSTADEIKAFATLGAAGSDALLLCQFLRTQHTARVKRGEAFRLNLTRMVDAKVLPGWSLWRLKRAVKLLREHQVLRVVRPCIRSNGRYRSAGYTITLKPFALSGSDQDAKTHPS